MVNYHELLGLNKNASLEEVKANYRKLCLENHPDREAGNEERFREVQAAFEVLIEEVSGNVAEEPEEEEPKPVPLEDNDKLVWPRRPKHGPFKKIRFESFFDWNTWYGDEKAYGPSMKLPSNCSIGSLWLIEDGNVCEQWDRFYNFSAMKSFTPLGEQTPIVDGEWSVFESSHNGTFFIGTGSGETPRVRVLARGHKDENSAWVVNQSYLYRYMNSAWWEQRVQLDEAERTFYKELGMDM